MECWGEGEVRAWSAAALREPFGTEPPEPACVETTGRTHDPYSQGAYSFIGVGSTPADIVTLAEPVDGRLFFAGEATHRHHWAAAHGRGRRTVTVVARGASSALQLDYDRFQRFLLAFPESCLALLKLTVGRLLENEANRDRRSWDLSSRFRLFRAFCSPPSTLPFIAA